MSVYKLFGALTGSGQNAIASLDVQFDGIITAMMMAADPDFDAADETFAAEISFLSTRTLDSNDSRGSLMVIRGRATLITAEPGVSAINVSVSGMRIPVTAGERIYMHGNSGAGVGASTTAFLYVEDTSDPRLRRRR